MLSLTVFQIACKILKKKHISVSYPSRQVFQHREIKRIDYSLRNKERVYMEKFDYFCSGKQKKANYETFGVDGTSGVSCLQ